MLKNKGFTYISVLVVFLLLTGTTYNLFYIIKNFKEQGKILDRNIEIFYNCNSLSKDSFPQREDYWEIIKNEILYVVERETEEDLVKTKVSAYQENILKKRISRYKYYSPEVLDEGI